MRKGLDNRKVEMTGKRFGRLVVIKEHPIRYKTGMIKWECKCDCGNTTIVIGATLRSGKTNSCGCLFLDTVRLDYGEAAFNKLYAGYIHGAKQRNLEFSLSRNKFKELTSSNCLYCGTEPKNEWGNGKYKKSQFFGNYIYNGIDRVDNKIGYTDDNCVPCCFTCNQMKLALTQEKFLSQIEKIYVKLAEKRVNYEGNIKEHNTKSRRKHSRDSKSIIIQDGQDGEPIRTDQLPDKEQALVSFRTLIIDYGDSDIKSNRDTTPET